MKQQSSAWQWQPPAGGQLGSSHMQDTAHITARHSMTHVEQHAATASGRWSAQHDTAQRDNAACHKLCSLNCSLQQVISTVAVTCRTQHTSQHVTAHISLAMAASSKVVPPHLIQATPTCLLISDHEVSEALHVARCLQHCLWCHSRALHLKHVLLKHKVLAPCLHNKVSEWVLSGLESN